jgi:hypothetical protein
MENKENDQKVSASKVQGDMINAIEWIQGIYDESYKLLEAIVTYFDDQGILMVKPPIEKTNSKKTNSRDYTYIFAQYLIVGSPSRKETNIIGAVGISLFDGNDKLFPRLLMSYMKLNKNIDLKELKKQYGKKGKKGSNAQYLILELLSDLKKNDDKANVFIPLSKKDWRPKTIGNRDIYKVDSAFFTDVPLASINSLDTLSDLLKSATPFFQEGKMDKELEDKVKELRAQVMQ